MGTGPGQRQDGSPPQGSASRRALRARREVLVMGGALVGAGAFAGAGALWRTQHEPRPPGPPGQAARVAPTRGATSPPAAPAAADWAALGRTLSTGHLVRPGQAGYRRARLLFDPRFDHLRPAAVAYCASAADVAACLAFVRRFALPVAARSGGHSYAGWSSTTGLIIDVTAMSSLRLGPGGRAVTVGAGIHLVDFYDGLARHGLAVPGGSCPTVGIAGLTLGGGVGVVGRAYGLTCDNLESVRMVTADGSVLDCDASRHSDLYWACRGGGGGNFGVATAFTFRTHRLPALAVFFLSWPWPQAARVIAAWQNWAPHAPDELWSNLHLSAAAGGGSPAIGVGGTYLGTTAAARGLLDTLQAAAGSAPSSTYLAQSSYLDAMLIDAGCSGMTVPECHLPWQAAGGRLTRQPEYAKSDFFTRPLAARAIGTLLAQIERLRGVRGAAGGAGGVAFDAFGGALNRVAADATAFVHRDALFLAQYTTGWPAGARPAGVARQREWLRSFHAAMRPYASGQAYQNYIDPGLADWESAYYGANYRRLAEVKSAYDPGRVFRFPQGIAPLH